MSRLSVVLCTHEGARHLPDLLHDLLAQERLPDELVVVDDASTDATRRLLHDLAARAPFPVRLDLAERRAGPAASFERALAAATGEVVALCDQDDRWYPSKLAALEAALAGGAALAFSDADLIGPAGEPRAGDLWTGVGFRGARRRRFAADPLAALLRGSIVTGCATAVRAEVVDRALPFPEALARPEAPMLHDRWLSLVAAATGEVVALPDRLLAYRVHPDQVTGLSRGPSGAVAGRVVLGEARRDLGQVRVASLARVAQLDALLDRAGEAAASPGALAQVRSARRQLRRRAALPRARAARLPGVLLGLVEGGYRRVGAGLPGAVADLVRPDRSAPPAPRRAAR